MPLAGGGLLNLGGLKDADTDGGLDLRGGAVRVPDVVAYINRGDRVPRGPAWGVENAELALARRAMRSPNLHLRDLVGTRKQCEAAYARYRGSIEAALRVHRGMLEVEARAEQNRVRVRRMRKRQRAAREAERAEDAAKERALASCDHAHPTGGRRLTGRGGPGVLAERAGASVE